MPAAASLVASTVLLRAPRVTEVLLAGLTAVSIRSLLRSLRERRHTRRPSERQSTTMDDFLDP